MNVSTGWRDWHPASEALAQFAGSNLAPKEREKVERHLDRCLSCRWRLDELLAQATGALLGGQGGAGGYEQAIERAVERASVPLGQVLRETEGASALLAELLRRPEGERCRLIREEERFRAIKLCQLLQARSREAWFQDPSAAVEFAELGVAVADRLDASRYSLSLVEDTQAMAWAYLGNSYRVASDFGKAEAALRTAFAHHRRAGEDTLTETEILSFLTSLRNNQGRSEESLSLVDRVIVLYREIEDCQGEAGALIQKSLICAHRGLLPEGQQLISKALLLLNEKEDPRLVAAAQHHLTTILVDSGEVVRAIKNFKKDQVLFREFYGAMDHVRRRWLRGRINRESNHLDQAETDLLKTRESFIDRGLAVGVARVNFELALVYARLGKLGKVKGLAEEMIPIFDASRLQKEAFAARLLYERATNG